MHHHHIAQHAESRTSFSVDEIDIRLREERARRDRPEPILSAKTPLNLPRIERLNDLRFGA